MAEFVGLFTRTEVKQAAVKKVSVPRQKRAPGSGKGKTKKSKATVSSLPLNVIQSLHIGQCNVCPLNNEKAYSPKMSPTGSHTPDLYILSDLPTEADDSLGRHLSSQSANYLLDILDEAQGGAEADAAGAPFLTVRANTCIRTRPDKGRPATDTEIECCRPSIVRDIEETKPRVIVAVGAAALKWLTSFSSIMHWRGRFMPVRVGSHVCWAYPIISPAFIQKLKSSRFRERIPAEEYERLFEFDVYSLVQAFDTLEPAAVEDPAHLHDGCHLLFGGEEDFETLLLFYEMASTASRISVDLETSCLRPYQKDAKILSISLTVDDLTIAVALEHVEAKWSADDLVLVYDMIEKLLSSGLQVVAQNLSFELEWFVWKFGPKIARASKWHDTMIAAYVIDERKDTHSLEDLSISRLGFNLKRQSNVDVANLATTPLKTVLLYNGPDSKYTDKLHVAMQKDLDRLGLQEVYQMQLRRIPTLVLAQYAGLPVDQTVVAEVKDTLAKQEIDLRKQIDELPVVKAYEQQFGSKFNPGSGPQLLKVFDDMLHCKEVTVGKRKTTDEDALSKIKHPLAKLVLELRKATKLVSTYIDPLDALHPRTVVYPDGMIHTSFNSRDTDTGRLSSSGPNVQNFPKRKNAFVRRIIAALGGQELWAADFGQIEARVIAMFSKDKALVEALWTDYDIHQEWAQRLAKESRTLLDTLGGDMKKLRAEVKNKLVFPAFYGSEEAPIADSLMVEKSVGRILFNEFWKQFYGVRNWQEEFVKAYENNNYVECLTGRRRHGPMNRNMVINTPVQGTASDIVIDAMNRLSEKAEKLQIPSLQPRMNIHDDLTFIGRREEREELIGEIVLEMIAVKYPWVNVPITIEVSVGPNWYEMKEIGKFSSRDFN